MAPQVESNTLPGREHLLYDLNDFSCLQKVPSVVLCLDLLNHPTRKNNHVNDVNPQSCSF